MDTSFEEDLGADSVDLVELVMAMEEEFDMGEAGEDELTGLKTVGDAVNYRRCQAEITMKKAPRHARGFLMR